MKITRPEGLLLAKLLYGHIPTTQFGEHDKHVKQLVTLAQKIDRFLVDGVDADHDSEFMLKLSEAKRVAATPLADAVRNRRDDIVVSGEALHELRAATSSVGAVEFELVDDSRVDLLVDGYMQVQDVHEICRSRNQLSIIGSDGGESWYEVAKFPRGWTTCLPIGRVVCVGGQR